MICVRLSVEVLLHVAVASVADVASSCSIARAVAALLLLLGLRHTAQRHTAYVSCSECAAEISRHAVGKCCSQWAGGAPFSFAA